MIIVFADVCIRVLFANMGGMSLRALNAINVDNNSSSVQYPGNNFMLLK